MSQLLNLVQEVYFDLSDIGYENNLKKKINGFEEFNTLEDFIVEQRQKVAQIESLVIQLQERVLSEI